MIEFTRAEWLSLMPRLETEYGKSIILIRTKMKDTLGCSYRYSAWPNCSIFLDFFNEASETFFRLKYL